MSLILAALRKSEAERRRGQAPDVFANPPVTAIVSRRGRAGWPWFAGVVALAGVLAALAWITTRPQAGGAAMGPDAFQGSALPSQAAAPAPASAPISDPPARTVRVTAPHPEAPPATTIAPEAAPADITDAPPPVAVVGPAPVTGTPLDTGAVTTLSELSPDERKQLPPLKLSLHLWDSQPARRFVILDGSRLREGDRTGPAVIVEIASDGVQLDWNGRALRLPLR
jgi:general secretion pathway protein B